MLHRLCSSQNGYLDGGASAASVQRLREFIRPLTDALANVLFGSLAGIFDGPTTTRLDFDGPIQTVDLSRIHARVMTRPSP